MPEIGEVARAVHYIRKHLVGRTIRKCTAFEDGNVFGKVGTSHTELMKHLTGKKIVSSAQQGKYFWMIMNEPPHLLMHFGMAGWLRFKSEHTFYYKKGSDKDREDEAWPPRWARFVLEMDPEKGKEPIEAAFVDMRRFARVRLVDCPGDQIRQHSPLKENGPDPVQDKSVVTVEWLKELCQKKKVPIKAMLLDQANISGIGNWVGDEIMYDAKMHPEQYANTLSDTQIEQLHQSLHYVCGLAVDVLSDSDKFPQTWLFKHRWGKGRKAEEKQKMPNGDKIVFLTVGGRTSAVVPNVQKKTGPVAKSMSEAESEDEKPAGKKAAKKGNKRVREEVEMIVAEPPAKKAKASKRIKKETADDVEDATPRKPKSASKARTTSSRKDDETGSTGKGKAEKTVNGVVRSQKAPKSKAIAADSEMKAKSTGNSRRASNRRAVNGIDSGNSPKHAEKSARRRSGRLRTLSG